MDRGYELKAAFDNDGFVHVPGFLIAHELLVLREALDRYKREVVPQLATDSHRAIYDEVNGFRHLKQLVDMQASDRYFRSLLEGERASGLASALLGEKALPQTVEYFAKAPERGTPTPPHQDGFYFCLTPNHAVTLWLALDDCDTENGCLQYVKGSHRAGVLDHGASGVAGFSQGLAERYWSADDVTCMHIAAGDLLAHHSLTIHFADANSSTRPRRSIGLIYYGTSARRDEQAWQRYQDSLAAQRRTATAHAGEPPKSRTA